MKGIILHGGHGTRLRPLTHTGPKQLLPIANKPMSQYALEDLKKTGIKDVAIIIGDVYPEKVKEYYGDGSKFGIKITYIFQDKPKGIAHAISLCKDFIGNDKFIVYLGDNVLRKNLIDYTKKFEISNLRSQILVSALGTLGVALLHPGHHATETGADLFDAVLFAGFQELVVGLVAAFIFLDQKAVRFDLSFPNCILAGSYELRA